MTTPRSATAAILPAVLTDRKPKPVAVRRDTNCKPARVAAGSSATRHLRRAARERRRLLEGMAGNECVFVTLVQRDGLNQNIRPNIWHPLWTRCRMQWPGAEAWTVIEYGHNRGVHLHAVIKGADGMTQEWLDRMSQLAEPGTDALLKPVYAASGLAPYLQKQLRALEYTSAWPCHFHPVSSSRRWLPRSNPPSHKNASSSVRRSESDADAAAKSGRRTRQVQT